MSNVYQTPESNLVNENSSKEKYGSIEKAIQGDYEFLIGAVISEAWVKTNGCKGVFNLSFFYYFLILIAIMIVMGIVTTELFSMGSMGDGMGVVSDSMSAGMMLMQVLIQFGVNLVSLPLVMGLFMMAIKRSVDAPISADMIFKYFSKMIPLFVTMVLMYVLIIIGFFLLVLPGIYLMVAYYMAMPLVVEKGMSPWQALETSRKAITYRWFSVFGLFFIMFTIVAISAIPLGIGMIWTVPMMVIAFAILYRNIFGVEPETISD